MLLFVKTEVSWPLASVYKSKRLKIYALNVSIILTDWIHLNCVNSNFIFRNNKNNNSCPSIHAYASLIETKIETFATFSTGWTDFGPVCLFRILRRMRSGICISGTCLWPSPPCWCCWPQPTTLMVQKHSHQKDLYIKMVNEDLFSLFCRSDDPCLFFEQNLRHLLCCFQCDR